MARTYYQQTQYQPQPNNQTMPYGYGGLFTSFSQPPNPYQGFQNQNWNPRPAPSPTRQHGLQPVVPPPFARRSPQSTPFVPPLPPLNRQRDNTRYNQAVMPRVSPRQSDNRYDEDYSGVYDAWRCKSVSRHRRRRSYDSDDRMSESFNMTRQFRKGRAQSQMMLSVPRNCTGFFEFRGGFYF